MRVTSIRVRILAVAGVTVVPMAALGIAVFRSEGASILLLVLGSLAVAGGLGAAWFVGARVVRRIESLTGAVESLAASDLSLRIADEVDDELGRLAAAFNAMVARVAERQADLDRARKDAETLLAIAQIVGGTNELREALRLVCRALARLTGAETVSAYVQDLGRGELRPVAAYHVPKEALEVLATAVLPLAEQGFRDEALRQGRAVWSDDVQGDSRFAFPLFRRFPHQSGIIVPLVFDEGIAGAFYLVWWRERRRFAEPELDALQAVGQQVGVLLRNARLYEQATRERQRLDVLNAVSRRLASVHETDQILSLIVEEASRLVHAEAVALRMLEGDELVLRARTDAAAPLATRPRVGARNSMAGLVLRAGAPVVVEDLGAESPYDPAHTRPPFELGFRGFLGIPLS